MIQGTGALHCDTTSGGSAKRHNHGAYAVGNHPQNRYTPLHKRGGGEREKRRGQGQKCYTTGPTTTTGTIPEEGVDTEEVSKRIFGVEAVKTMEGGNGNRDNNTWRKPEAAQDDGYEYRHQTRINTGVRYVHIGLPLTKYFLAPPPPTNAPCFYGIVHHGGDIPCPEDEAETRRV